MSRHEVINPVQPENIKSAEGILGCPIIHQWDFQENGKPEEDSELQLRQAVQHMILNRHQINGSEYGGYRADESLSYKLSLIWFKRVGLLQPIAFRFGGDINAVLDFSFPEGLSKIEPVKMTSKRTSKEIAKVETSPEKKSVLQQFFEDAIKFPLLDRLEQQRIIFDYIKNGRPLDELKRDSNFLSTIKPEDTLKLSHAFRVSKDVKDLFLNCNLRLIIKFVKNYQGRGLSFSELINEGFFGLEKAVEMFNPEFGFKFSTYASYWIKQNADRAIKDRGRPIRVPVHMEDSIGKVIKIASRFEALHSRLPTDEEIRDLMIAHTELSENRINSVIETMNSGVTKMSSLDMPVGEDEESSLSDLVADKTQNLEEIAVDNLTTDETRREIEESFSRQGLNERERNILRLRYGFDSSKMTLQQVGDELGLTRERIRQLESISLRKLRKDHRLWARWWEKDPPSFIYRGISAEEAALKLGLLDDDNLPRQQQGVPLEEMAKVKIERKSLPSAKQVRKLVERAKGNERIWDLVPTYLKSALNLYVGEDNQEAKNPDEISKVLNMPRGVLEGLINESLINLTELLENPEKDRVWGRAGNSKSIDQLVEETVLRKPDMRIKEIVLELSNKLGKKISEYAIGKAKSRLIAEGRIVSRFLRPLPAKEMDALDSQVETLIKQNLSPQQIAIELIQDLRRIRGSIRRLKEKGNIPKGKPSINYEKRN